MIFKFEPVRKDQLLQCIIHLISIILRRHGLHRIPVARYRVVPTSSCTGCIETMRDSDTIYQLVQHEFSPITYMMEHNPRATVQQLLQRFIRSCAVYSVITYIFGIGDRHFDNIMLSRRGELFHIDFSYILGHDPKYLRRAQPMRLPPALIEAMGGVHSRGFAYFKRIFGAIFQILIPYANLFIIMLSTLKCDRHTCADLASVNIEQHIIDHMCGLDNIECIISSAKDNELSTLGTSTLVDFRYHANKRLQQLRQRVVDSTRDALSTTFHGITTAIASYVTAPNVHVAGNSANSTSTAPAADSLY